MTPVTFVAPPIGYKKGNENRGSGEVTSMTTYITWFENVGIQDISRVGGKNASLGEMVRGLQSKGLHVPDGFATTSDAYWHLLHANHLKDRIDSLLRELKNKPNSLRKVGRAIRRTILASELPAEVAEQIRAAYRDLGKKYNTTDVDVAVRSSATAEDLPDASFAGQQESFLNVRGENQVLEACRKCYASLFTDRAIAYRREKGFDHMKVALSIGIQKMVRSDLAGSGVMFTIDTESGFPDVIVINAAWGLGENVVQGAVNPDQYTVFKPLLSSQAHKPIIEKTLGDKHQKMIYLPRRSPKAGKGGTINIPSTAKERTSYVLTDDEILTLSNWAVEIETYYQKPMDIEWAKDGISKELFIVQARPETVHSRERGGALKTYKLTKPGKKLLEGLAIGEAITTGSAQLINSPKDIDRFTSGAILVTGTTDPDWVPIMKKAAGIVTDHGGRTSHAAIVSRELGIPAVVGAGNATDTLTTNQPITLSCAEGEKGVIYDGLLPFEETEVNMEKVPKTKTRILMNIASPEAAFHWWRLPSNGIGLARMEFIISDVIKIHPMALAYFERLKNKKIKQTIARLTKGFSDKTQYFVHHLASGIAKVAASQFPDPVIVRMSDFKTNEYANLIGGKQFEPEEGNPMIGFRGASRYYNDKYRDGFGLECKAIKRVREEMGLQNVIVMIPFCRTLEEADKVLGVMAENGLKRGENGLEVYVMCEIPSNVILAEKFADRFDGFSIGSNDLTQLILGVDRDSEDLAPIFDERNEAVMTMIQDVIERAHKKHCKVGICGQAPSDHPDFAEFLVRCGIDSISLNPDSVVSVIHRIAKLEAELSGQRQPLAIQKEKPLMAVKS